MICHRPVCTYTLVGCYVSCQLCLARNLTAQDVPCATSSKRPLVPRVALALSLSCAFNLTVLYSDWTSSFALLRQLPCLLGIRLVATCLNDRKLSGFICFAQVISRRTSCFRLCIFACCCRPCTRVVYPTSSETQPIS